jgi:hypothetical protein
VSLRLLAPRRLVLCAAALLAAIGASAGAAAPAHAALGIACPDPTTKAFAQWGDQATYALAPDGGFEHGATGWTLSGGARVVAGSEPFAVSGPGSSALSLPAGSSAMSPPMCIGLLSTQMRLFTASAAGTSARLRVQVVYNSGAGALIGGLGSTLGIADVGTLASGQAWQPSAPVAMLGGAVPLLTQSVQFRFTPIGGGWRIDDVYLDPLMHR